MHWSRAATVLLTILAAFLIPATAHAAGTFQWKADTSGNWNDASKWTHIGGDLGSGFPNGPGDTARINLLFAISRTITIPAGVSVTIGTLSFGATPGLVIKSGGAGARLVFESGSASNATLLKFGDAGIDMEVPVVMRSRLGIFTDPGDPVKFSSPISGEPQAIGIEKTGPGAVFFEAENTFTGLTNVNEGALVLRCETAPSVLGNLTIGDGVGPAQSAAVFVEYDEQIGSEVDKRAGVVNVKADGNLTLNLFRDVVGTLNVTDGVVRCNGGVFYMHALNMTGGVLYADAGGHFVPLGDAAARSSAVGPARIDGVADTAIYLLEPTQTFNVADGPAAIDLDISIPVICDQDETIGVIKGGDGTLRFSGAGQNDHRGETWVREGRLELTRPAGLVQINALRVGDGPGPAVVSIANNHIIKSGQAVMVGANGTLLLNASQDVGSVTINGGGHIGIEGGELTATFLSMNSSRVALGANGVMTVRGDLAATSSATRPATIEGDGLFRFEGADRVATITNGAQPIDLRISAHLVSGAAPGRLKKRGFGAIELAGLNSRSDVLAVEEGTLIVTGSHAAGPITLAAGTTLGGTGTLGAVDAAGARVAPGLSPGTLESGSIAFNSSTIFAIEIAGTTAGTGYDSLNVKGSVGLNGAELSIENPGGFTPPAGNTFTIIDNDGTDPVIGTFAGYAEGAEVLTGQRRFSISYRGGDGNDVVLADPSVLTYFLAEGATGAFFDDDVLIANPNEVDAPITLTFLREGGSTVVEKRIVGRQSRLTVHVDQIASLEDASVSVQVASDNRLPLVVERSMFWDESYYGGHTANAVAQPETRWIFAEGFQGFFDTYILIANANAEATTATLTFLTERSPSAPSRELAAPSATARAMPLRENDTPVVKTVDVAPFARKTIYAGDYDELKGRAFGIVVEATKPVIAERAMYFASQPGRLWSGGHVNTGITAPSTSWFHAEGATGGYFNTFILLSNPQDTPAHVELRFLLATGEVITRTKTIDAKQRLTINPAMEGDTRLENAAVSTVVQSDVPIVSERSMYWSGEAGSFGEGHNSSGIVSTTTLWGLAEGRIGGPHQFDTFILLANPSASEAEVTITYLREGGGAPIVKTYTVPGTSRYNVDVKTVVPELRDTSFGAVIEVKNDIPIAVERSLYWNALGAFWAGGTNALGTPLPVK